MSNQNMIYEKKGIPYIDGLHPFNERKAKKYQFGEVTVLHDLQNNSIRMIFSYGRINNYKLPRRLGFSPIEMEYHLRGWLKSDISDELKNMLKSAFDGFRLTLENVEDLI